MARSGPKYPPELDEAIWALMCEGVRHADIRRMLAAGEAGLEQPHDPPARTYFDHVARLKDQRGEPKLAVREGQEVDAAAAIGRRALEMLNRQMAELEQKEKAGTNGLPARDLGRLRQLERTAADIARRAAEKPGDRAKRFGRKAQLGHDKREGKPPTLLGRLAKETGKPDTNGS